MVRGGDVKPAQLWSIGISFVLLLATSAWFSTRSVSCTWAPLAGNQSGPSTRKPLDINKATFEQLDAIPYMTPQMAQGIVEGQPWRSIDKLIAVRGIGEVTLNKIRPYLYVADAPLL
ncbi:MAG: hypothetical protein ACI9TH_002359 [Kiritimatiellia bacterium]|jgi:hypothetical protein